MAVACCSLGGRRCRGLWSWGRSGGCYFEAALVVSVRLGVGVRTVARRGRLDRPPSPRLPRHSCCALMNRSLSCDRSLSPSCSHRSNRTRNRLQQNVEIPHSNSWEAIPARPHRADTCASAATRFEQNVVVHERLTADTVRPVGRRPRTVQCPPKPVACRHPAPP